jgi:hypothetical protein
LLSFHEYFFLIFQPFKKSKKSKISKNFQNFQNFQAGHGNSSLFATIEQELHSLHQLWELLYGNKQELFWPVAVKRKQTY